MTDSFLELVGRVENVLLTPEGVTKEGESYGGHHQVQLICQETLRNGQSRLQMFTLRTDTPEAFSSLQGSHVAVPVGVFARGGNVQFYQAKGSQPRPWQGAESGRERPSAA